MSNSYDISVIASKLVADIANTIETDVKQTCEEALMRAIMKSVYSGHTPKMYIQTHEFVNAVEVMNISVGGGRASFDVTINASKMSASPPSGGNWGTHMGMNGEDFRSGLIEGLDQGTSGSPYYNHPAYNFFDSTSTVLNMKLVQVMVSALRGRGWDARVM